MAYVTAAEVQAEGATSTVARINSRIEKWEAIVEGVTRNVFRVLEPGELIFDGNNSDMLHFNIPLIEVTELKVNNSDDALDADEYRAYTGRTPPQDDRSNPKLELTGSRSNSLYSKAHGVFYKGMDQKLTAKWGYVNDDGAGGYETPAAVKGAIIELVCMDLDGYFDQQGSAVPLSSLRRERTDGHELEYQDVATTAAVWNMIPRSIADVLALYRAPWKITSPDNRKFSYNVSVGVQGVWPLIVGI